MKETLKSLSYYEQRLLGKCLTMFEWENLPDDIPIWFLNFALLCGGECGFVKRGDKYYIVNGSDGGTKVDAYNRTNYFIGANPEFSVNVPVIWDKEMEVPDGDSAVICWNDSFRYGILDLIREYAAQLAECDKSLKIALKNTRDTKMISVTTENAKNQAQVALNKMYEGEPYAFYDEGSCIGFGDAKSLFDNSSKNNHLQDIVTTRADILSRFCIEIGIPLVNNTKRSQLITGEVGGIKTLGIINVDDMLRQRKRFCDLVNYAYGLDISVELNENWKLEIDDDPAEESAIETETDTEPVQPANEDADEEQEETAEENEEKDGDTDED